MINEHGYSITTLNSLIIMGHNTSLELTLILIMGINEDNVNCQPTPNLQAKVSVGQMNVLVGN